MELSRHEFFDLLEQFEKDRPDGEGRRTPRVLVRRQVMCVADAEDPNGSELAMVLQDISRGGVRLTYHQGMPRGKRFTFILSAGPSGLLKLLCVVKHCEMLKQHLFRIGAEFESVVAQKA